jgi:exopolysaccharide biosynthesis operon protein EpsL
MVIRKNIDWAPARSRPPGKLHYPLSLLAGALCCMPALAALSDTLHPFAAAAYSYEDNLLRLPDNTPGGPRSDTIRQVQAGLLLERPIGRQKLSGHAKFSDVRFNRFERLNYKGKDGLAALEWQLGNHLDGHLGASYVETLAPFADLEQGQRNVRNLRLARRQYADGGWRFHPSWRARAGLTRERIDYDRPDLSFNDRAERGTELGLDYLAASGSVAGLLLRRVTNTYANRIVSGPFVINDNFEQNEVKANIDWRYSGITRVRFVGGHVRRKHDSSNLLDANGTNGRLIVDWSPLGKVRFNATGWREFSAIESTLVNSSLNKGASVGAAWDASARVRLDAQLKREKRDFSAASGIALSGDTSDTTHNASLGIVYAPRAVVQLAANVFRDVRSGSAAIGTASYRANGASFSISAQF